MSENASVGLSVSEYLKFADLQMAAEAFLKTVDGETRYSGTPLIDALKAGNGHASRFTSTQAAAFNTEWEVLDQTANTPTGFSGTLFKNRKTNELVISFR